MTESTTALKEATTVLSEVRRRYQALDIELQSAHSLVSAFVQDYITGARRTFNVSPVIKVSNLGLDQYTLSGLYQV